MAKDVEVNVKINSNLDKISKDVDKLNKEISEVKESAKKAEEGTSALAKGFSGIGGAIKAMGIGLALEAFQALKDIFFSNQKVVDALAIAMGTLKIVFNDLFKFIENNIGGVVDYFKAIFNDPQQAIKDFGDAIKENLVERFNSFLDTLGFIASAVKKVFSGDFTGALNDVKLAGKESLDVLTGVNNVFDKTVKVVGEAVDAFGNYIGAAIDTAAANVALQKSAEIAIAKNKGLIETYDAIAEKQRQIRDNETNSIADRIKANENLGKTLDKQAALMTANAQLVLKAAQNEFALNNTQENRIKLIEAQNGVAEVSAKIEALRSEQLQNRNNLTKEQIALNNTASDGEKRRAQDQLAFQEEIALNEDDKFQKRKDQIAQEEQDALDKLERDRALYKEGTQARADAEQEYLDGKQERDQANTQNELGEIARIEQAKLDSLQVTADNEELTFQERRDALDEQNTEILASTSLSEEQRTAALKTNSEARKNLDKAEAAAKQAFLAAGANSLKQAASLLGESTAAGKAAAIAAATIDTYQSAVSAYKSLSGIPVVGPALGAVAAGIAIASGIANVKKIISVKTPKGDSGGATPSATAVGAPPAVTTPIAPVAPTLFGNSINQNNQTAATAVQGKTEQVITVNAVVSETEITATQGKIKQIQQSSELGG